MQVASLNDDSGGGIHGGERFFNEQTGEYAFIKMTTPREHIAERLGMRIGRELGLHMHEVTEIVGRDYDALMEMAGDGTIPFFGKYEDSEGSLGDNNRVIATAVAWGGVRLTNENCKDLHEQDRSFARMAVLDAAIRNGDRHGSNVVVFDNWLYPIDHAFGLHQARSGTQYLSFHYQRVRTKGKKGWEYIDMVHEELLVLHQWHTTERWANLWLDQEAARLEKAGLADEDMDAMRSILNGAAKRGREVMGGILRQRYEWEKGGDRL